MRQTTVTEAAAPVPRIKALDDVLSNQIAAGEVVERPASVAKELIENSFDAGARNVRVEVEGGGVALVRVRDDGCGIHAADLTLALSRHATSKIASLGDLEQVRSFGFRGEALPSIASVSRLSLASRTADSGSGFEVAAAGAAFEGVRPSALPAGTLVSVRDLFFNTPARRKFLRTERTEFRHLEDVVKRAALARFDVGLSFFHNGREVFRLAPAPDGAARRARLARLLGAAFAGQALEVDIEASGMKLSGWIGTPGAARAHSDLQYVFINGRAVRDSTARHAVRQAFGERLVSGRHPAYVLYLDIEPSQVDVNVHPAKSEVRFRESRLVHDFLWRGLYRALDGELDLPAAEEAVAVPSGEAATALAAGRVDIADRGVAYGVAAGSEAASPWSADSSPGVAFGASPALVAGRYAVSVDAEGVALADLARARRAMIHLQLEAGCGEELAVSRPLLLPLSRGVPVALADRVEARLGAVPAAGFELRRSAPGSITLRAVPACLAHVPAAVLLDTLLRWASLGADQGTETLADALAEAGGERLEDLADDPRQVSALLRFIDAQTEGEGAPLVTRLDAAAIAELMKR